MTGSEPPPPAGEGLSLLKDFLQQGKLKEAKIMLRKSHPDDIAGVWLSILGSHTRDSPVDTSDIYWDTVQTCFGGTDLQDCVDRTPGCVDSNHTPTFDLNKDAKAQVCRLVTCLPYNSPDIPFCPLLFPSAAVLRKYLSEEDCFAVLCMMVEPPKGMSFFTQSKRSWDISTKAIKPLALKYIKKHISTLERLCGGDQVDSALTGWVWWIFEFLPFKYIERIFSSFLLEGQKVLYRIGLAVLKLFAKSVSADSSALNNDNFNNQIQRFCQGLSIPVDELMRVAFKIPRFSRAEINKTALRLEMELKSLSTMRAEEGQGRRRSNEELLTTDGAQQIVAVSDTLSYKKLMQLWSLIPERITMIMPKLVYSTNDDGTSLKTFYHKSENFEPTILLIKTTKGDIFGAYCSTAWTTRNEKDDRGMRQRYFGTGESFLFKFAGEEMEKFCWVGEGAEKDRAQQLFMSGDNTFVTVGGGDGTGLYLDENLEFGRTESCRTFNNPPLAQEKDFIVSVVEVYGFNNLDW